MKCKTYKEMFEALEVKPLIVESVSDFKEVFDRLNREKFYSEQKINFEFLTEQLRDSISEYYPFETLRFKLSALGNIFQENGFRLMTLDNDVNSLKLFVIQNRSMCDIQSLFFALIGKREFFQSIHTLMLKYDDEESQKFFVKINSKITQVLCNYSAKNQGTLADGKDIRAIGDYLLTRSENETTMSSCIRAFDLSDGTYERIQAHQFFDRKYVSPYWITVEKNNGETIGMNGLTFNSVKPIDEDSGNVIDCVKEPSCYFNPQEKLALDNGGIKTGFPMFKDMTPFYWHNHTIFFYAGTVDTQKPIRNEPAWLLKYDTENNSISNHELSDFRLEAPESYIYDKYGRIVIKQNKFDHNDVVLRLWNPEEPDAGYFDVYADDTKGHYITSFIVDSQNRCHLVLDNGMMISLDDFVEIFGG